MTEFECECTKCGNKVTTDKHCLDTRCPKCGGDMRRADRPGRGEGPVGMSEHDDAILVLQQEAPNKMIEIYEDLKIHASHDPFRADESRPWDGSGARKRLAKWASNDGSGDKEKMSWTKYFNGFVYVDPEQQDNLGAYKLPHHDIVNGKFATVWSGVRAAMGALLGARGGVDIPASEKRAAYRHLAAHYRQLKRDPPEFR